MSLISCVNLSRTYGTGTGSVKALQNINMDIDKGEYMAIVGPSGSGKSTLLQILGLLDKPTEGKLFLNDVEVSSAHDNLLSEMRGKHIGFVFQSFHLLPRLSVEENVALPLVYQKVSPSVRKKMAQKVLERVSMTHRLGHYPHELSGGERQRVAIARAMVHEPQILFADEPTGNLDSKVKCHILDDLQSLNEKENVTVVLVTHDEETAKYARRTVRILDGQIYEDIKGGQL